MADALHTVDDYDAQLLSLLPSGLAWPTDVKSIVVATMAGLSPSFARLDAAAQTLLVDAFPSTAVELLPEWEESLGLPDPCAGESPTIAQRQGQVVARLTDGGGQSAQYFIDYAAALGFPITIRKFGASRFGRRFGASFGSSLWIFIWAVVAPLNTVRRMSFGGPTFGQPFRSWGNRVLECEISARVPAHTKVLFVYGPSLDFSSPDNSQYLPGL